MKCFFAIFFSFSIFFLAFFGINCFYGYFFPIKFSTEIEAAANNYDVEQAIIYSVINVESRFQKNIISNKGAVGLMQVLPSTANEVATKLNMEEFDLKNPHDNIMIGTYYLSCLLKRFKNIETALAAYNAGAKNVSEWLKNETYSTDGETLKDIPFKETKNYITKFRQNIKYYSQKI